MPSLKPVRWDIHDDAAWARVGPGCYTHYSGVNLIQKGKLWNACTPDGDVLPGHKAPFDAVVSLHQKGFWTLQQLDDFTREYGAVRHTSSVVSRDKPMYFVFWAAHGEEFPTFVKSTLARGFFGKARCAGCSASMVSFQTRTVLQFDGLPDVRRTYFACECGYPVWRMPWEHYSGAFDLMEQNAKPYRRKRMLAEAGGTHSSKDIREILSIQKSRCIYCNRLFGPDLRPTKDHLLALCDGGQGWALNIVLACRRCNSSRAELPFRTFCRMLSPAQNKRIFLHLVRRLTSLSNEETTNRGLRCFDFAMSQHDTKSFRYRCMRKRKSAVRNLQVNKLLPTSASGILKTYIAILRKENRRIHASRA